MGRGRQIFENYPGFPMATIRFGIWRGREKERHGSLITRTSGLLPFIEERGKRVQVTCTHEAHQFNEGAQRPLSPSLLYAPARSTATVQESWLLKRVAIPAGLMMSGEWGAGRHNENKSTGRVQRHRSHRSCAQTSQIPMRNE